MSAVFGIALAIAAPIDEAPWEGDWPANLAWAAQTDNGDRFWIVESELSRGPANTFTVWLHGHHNRNNTVKYRTSLWRFHFWCTGSTQLLAYTKRYPDGRTEQWDGFAQASSIRPGTIYQEIEKKFCLK